MSDFEYPPDVNESTTFFLRMMTIYYFLVNHNDLDHDLDFDHDLDRDLDFDHDLNHDLCLKVEVAEGMTSMVVDIDGFSWLFLALLKIL